MMTCTPLISLSLFGVFRCELFDGNPIEVRGAKHRALLAILAVAANGVHSRGWLQEHLWGRSGADHGRASLRRALSDLRKVFGPHFDTLFEITNLEIRLQPELINIEAGPHAGEFLEGIRIQEPKFNAWLAQQRGQESPRFATNADERLDLAPSVAILPIVSVHNSPDEVHFGDLVAAEISRSLSRSRLVDVISHLSSRQLQQPMLALTHVKADLNVTYVLTGNLRLNGQRYRLDADFIAVDSGRILWTRSYEGQMAEILNGQGEAISHIARACGREMLRAAVELAQSRPLPVVESHALFMAAISNMHRYDDHNFELAKLQLEELVLRLPQHAVLHAWRAKWHILSISQGRSANVSQSSEWAKDNTKRALDLDPHCPTSLTIDGMIQGDRRRDTSVALSRFQQATEIDPNQALAWLMYSRLHSFSGNGQAAVECAMKARKLSPLDPYGYFYDVMASIAHLVDGNYTSAITLAKSSIDSNAQHTSSFRALAIALQLNGEGAAARGTVKKLLRLEPTLTIKSYLASHPAGKLPTGKLWASALHEAGVPS